MAADAPKKIDSPFTRMLDALDGRTVTLKVGAGLDAVEEIVDRKLAERDRAQAIEERMNWQ